MKVRQFFIHKKRPVWYHSTVKKRKERKAGVPAEKGMEINILQLVEGAKAARGLTVIIDVFRAMTVEAYIMRGNAAALYPVGDKDLAYRYKEEHPEAILVGERNGVMLPGFDFGNSPSQVKNVDFTGKTVVHTTSAGTQGTANAKGASEIITGALVNAKAIARYIRKKNPETVSLVCMGLNAERPIEEDTLCAEYIRSLLLGDPIDPRKEIPHLKETSGAKFFDPKNSTVFPEEDFHLSVEPDVFDFVLRVETDANGFQSVKKIEV